MLTESDALAAATFRLAQRVRAQRAVLLRQSEDVLLLAEPELGDLPPGWAGSLDERTRGRVPFAAGGAPRDPRVRGRLGRNQKILFGLGVASILAELSGVDVTLGAATRAASARLRRLVELSYDALAALLRGADAAVAGQVAGFLRDTPVLERAARDLAVVAAAAADARPARSSAAPAAGSPASTPRSPALPELDAPRSPRRDDDALRDYLDGGGADRREATAVTACSVLAALAVDAAAKRALGRPDVVDAAASLLLDDGPPRDVVLGAARLLAATLQRPHAFSRAATLEHGDRCAVALRALGKRPAAWLRRLAVFADDSDDDDDDLAARVDAAGDLLRAYGACAAELALVDDGAQPAGDGGVEDLADHGLTLSSPETLQPAACEVFDMIDTDGSGAITFEEIMDALQSNPYVFNFMNECGDERLASFCDRGRRPPDPFRLVDVVAVALDLLFLGLDRSNGGARGARAVRVFKLVLSRVARLLEAVNPRVVLVRRNVARTRLEAEQRALAAAGGVDVAYGVAAPQLDDRLRVGALGLGALLLYGGVEATRRRYLENLRGTDPEGYFFQYTSDLLDRALAARRSATAAPRRRAAAADAAAAAAAAAALRAPVDAALSAVDLLLGTRRDDDVGDSRRPETALDDGFAPEPPPPRPGAGESYRGDAAAGGGLFRCVDAEGFAAEPLGAAPSKWARLRRHYHESFAVKGGVVKNWARKPNNPWRRLREHVGRSFVVQKGVLDHWSRAARTGARPASSATSARPARADNLRELGAMGGNFAALLPLDLHMGAAAALDDGRVFRSGDAAAVAAAANLALLKIKCLTALVCALEGAGDDLRGAIVGHAELRPALDRVALELREAASNARAPSTRRSCRPRSSPKRRGTASRGRDDVRERSAGKRRDRRVRLTSEVSFRGGCRVVVYTAPPYAGGGGDELVRALVEEHRGLTVAARVGAVVRQAALRDAMAMTWRLTPRIAEKAGREDEWRALGPRSAAPPLAALLVRDAFFIDRKARIAAYVSAALAAAVAAGFAAFLAVAAATVFPRSTRHAQAYQRARMGLLEATSGEPGDDRGDDGAAPRLRRLLFEDNALALPPRATRTGTRSTSRRSSPAAPPRLRRWYAKIDSKDAFWYCTAYDFATASEEIVGHALLLGVVACGVFASCDCFGLLLLEIVLLSSSLRNVTRAILRPFNELLVATYLMCVVCLVFTVVGLLAFQSLRGDDHYCKTVKECLFLNVYHGIVNGELVSVTKHVTNDAATDYHDLLMPSNAELKRMLLQLVFNIVVALLLLNMISGIILDAFTQETINAQRLAERRANENFATGLTRARSSRPAELDFAEHQALFSMRNYVHFVGYLAAKDPSIDSPVEAYVRAKNADADSPDPARHVCRDPEAREDRNSTTLRVLGVLAKTFDESNEAHVAWTPKMLAIMTMSLTKLFARGREATTIRHGIVRQVVECADEFDGRGAANVCGALGKCVSVFDVASSAPLFEALAPRIVDLLPEIVESKFAARDLSEIAWGVFKVGWRDRCRVLLPLSEASVEVLPRFIAQDLANLAQALASLDHSRDVERWFEEAWNRCPMRRLLENGLEYELAGIAKYFAQHAPVDVATELVYLVGCEVPSRFFETCDARRVAAAVVSKADLREMAIALNRLVVINFAGVDELREACVRRAGFILAEARANRSDGVGVLWALVVAARPDDAREGFRDLVRDLWTGLLDAGVSHDDDRSQLAQVWLSLRHETDWTAGLPEPPSTWAATLTAQGVRVSRAQESVSQVLRECGFAHEMEVDLDGTGLTADAADVDARVAVEYDGPQHYLADRTQTGRTRFKHRLVRALGWRLVVVSHYGWEQASDKRAYVEDRLARPSGVGAAGGESRSTNSRRTQHRDRRRAPEEPATDDEGNPEDGASSSAARPQRSLAELQASLPPAGGGRPRSSAKSGGGKGGGGGGATAARAAGGGDEALLRKRLQAKERTIEQLQARLCDVQAAADLDLTAPARVAAAEAAAADALSRRRRRHRARPPRPRVPPPRRRRRRRVASSRRRR
ncbi:ryanodine-sensitive calcium-release channel [Aureococcus anophagefferens]|nr:ryanodine-sensitive calcium-release channel [Aureococcus anophagefferens]